MSIVPSVGFSAIERDFKECVVEALPPATQKEIIQEIMTIASVAWETMTPKQSCKRLFVDCLGRTFKKNQIEDLSKLVDVFFPEDRSSFERSVFTPDVPTEEPPSKKKSTSSSSTSYIAPAPQPKPSSETTNSINVVNKEKPPILEIHSEWKMMIENLNDPRPSLETLDELADLVKRTNGNSDARFYLKISSAIQDWRTIVMLASPENQSPEVKKALEAYRDLFRLAGHKIDDFLAMITIREGFKPGSAKYIPELSCLNEISYLCDNLRTKIDVANLQKNQRKFNEGHKKINIGVEKGDDKKSKYVWKDGLRRLDNVSERMEKAYKDHSYVSFTNPAYDEKYGKNDGLSTWKIHVSIELAKLQEAWPIVQKALEETKLKIHGKIMAVRAGDEKEVQPGKEIIFLIDNDDMDTTKWQTFLSSLAQGLHKANIKPEGRPLNSDPKQATRKWDATVSTKGGIPQYFSYRTDLYSFVEDDLFSEITQGYTLVNNGNIAKAPDSYGPAAEKMVKASYYQKLPPEQKHNPAGEKDFLKNVQVSF